MARPHRPKGAWSEKAFRDALRIAVLEKNAGTPRLRLLADRLVSAGLAGDVAAIREIADRLDGKPKQESETTIKDERMVVEAPRPAKDADSWASEHGPH
ncbi:hypothetical protein UFOVP833_6 [uncultured Caudovirales phage]|uniref:Uncharacterized protein n=1 Tax=uncultured Caudovirales phage TaxID=2100421 RepID=A0A6J5SSZ9_9CAUD|nr:hypothetical protein UFOVP833_6 [uncultured Caudovirales phage]CAB4218206.1 hypothetical protein UFOVP1603_19 [uncultured Caudovirales phage]